LTATGIVGEEAAQVKRLNVGEVGFECAPRGTLSKRDRRHRVLAESRAGH
jgi:hypothetical protein